MSRVGKKSITLPDKVTVKVNGSSVQVEGPKGKLSWTLPEGITATVEGNQLSVDRVGESRQLRALHGTNRSLLNNMVIGVSEGFVKNLEIVGVGFRAAVKGNNLIKLGIFCRKHHDGQRFGCGIFAQAAQHLKAVDFGQHDVKQHQLRQRFTASGEEIARISEPHGIKPRLTQRIHRQVANIGIVF